MDDHVIPGPPDGTAPAEAGATVSAPLDDSMTRADREAIELLTRTLDRVAVAKSFVRVASGMMREQASMLVHAYGFVAMRGVATGHMRLNAELARLLRFARASAESAAYAAERSRWGGARTSPGAEETSFDDVAPSSSAPARPSAEATYDRHASLFQSVTAEGARSDVFPSLRPRKTHGAKRATR